MKKLLFIFLSVFLLISCLRVEERAKGDLRTVKLKKLDAIPLEYGSLVGVTANQKFPKMAQLWFEDDDRNIRVVGIALDEDRINERVTVIPRH